MPTGDNEDDWIGKQGSDAVIDKNVSRYSGKIGKLRDCVNQALVRVVSLVPTLEDKIMKHALVESWDSVMDNRHNPLRHLDLASQHYFMQVLGWMWSMVFSLSFLSIFQFGYAWLGHLLLISGVCITVAVFKEAEKQKLKAESLPLELSNASRCVWKMDSEA